MAVMPQSPSLSSVTWPARAQSVQGLSHDCVALRLLGSEANSSGNGVENKNGQQIAAPFCYKVWVHDILPDRTGPRDFFLFLIIMSKSCAKIVPTSRAT